MKVKDEVALLREHKIYNDWGLIGKGGWNVYFNSGAGERASTSSGWNIYCRGKRINTGHELAWYERADCINVSGKYRAKDKDEVLALATKMSGINDWRRSPFGGYSYVSAEAVNQLIKRLQEEV